MTCFYESLLHLQFSHRSCQDLAPFYSHQTEEASSKRHKNKATLSSELDWLKLAKGYGQLEWTSDNRGILAKYKYESLCAVSRFLRSTPLSQNGAEALVRQITSKPCCPVKDAFQVFCHSDEQDRAQPPLTVPKAGYVTRDDLQPAQLD